MTARKQLSRSERRRRQRYLIPKSALRSLASVKSKIRSHEKKLLVVCRRFPHLIPRYFQYEFASRTSHDVSIRNAEAMMMALQKIYAHQWLESYLILSKMDPQDANIEPLKLLCRINLSDPYAFDDIKTVAWKNLHGPIGAYVACTLKTHIWKKYSNPQDIEFICACALEYFSLSNQFRQAASIQLPVEWDQDITDIFNQCIPIFQDQKAKKVECEKQNEKPRTENSDTNDDSSCSSASQIDEETSNPVNITGYEDIMNMIGIKPGKDKVNWILGLKWSNPRSFNPSIVLTGPPGVGKTGFINHYAKSICDVLGFGSCDYFSFLNYDLMALSQAIAKSKLVILDDIHILNLEDRKEKDLLNSIDHRLRSGGAVFWVGQVEGIEKLFEFRPTLRSYFPATLNFENLNEGDLETLFKIQLEKKVAQKPEIEGSSEESTPNSPMKVLARRMVQASKAPGFTNGWHVRNLVDQVLERQGRRMKEENVAAENKHHFTRQDLLGPDPQIDLSLCPAWIELQNMVGLKQVKESILNLHQIVLGNMEREKVGLPKLDISLNRMILGNPGTGKTTVGYLYGQILKHLGLLSDGSVVIKKPSDFISKNLGGSEANTKAILRSTIGKVLIIDEAYSLMGDGNGLHSTDSFNAAVIDTIISEVQNVPGEDRCVLLLGYREQMESMLTNANPGLSRRFLPENSLIINDYTDAELVQIFNGKLKKRALKAGIDTQLAAWDALKKDARRPNFGNAGAVENLISTSIQRMQGRIRPLPISEQAQSSQLLPVDVNPDWKPSTDILLSDIDIEDLLKDFVGFEDVVEQLNVYKSTIAMALQSGRDPMVDVPMNYLFVGPPGTGKTSLARRFAKIFHSFGLLATDDVVEVSASNLVAGFVGQTAILTKQVLKKGLGRILFIDEAYRLRPDRGNSFAKEALDEIVDQLTKPEFHGKLVVILAGYEADIHSLLDANPGLSSRFPEQIKFAHLEPPVCCDLLERQLQEKGFKIDTWNPQQRGTLINTLTRLSQTKNWGNGRDIQTLSQRIVRTFARRTLQSKGEMLKMCPTMILDCAKQFLSERLEMTKNQAMKQNSSRYPGLQTTSLDMTVACRAKKINDREPPSSKEGEDKSPKGKSKKKRSKRNSKTDEHLNNSASETDEKAKMTEEEVQKTLRRQGLCPQGYDWKPEGNGIYRCAGGTHVININEL